MIHVCPHEIAALLAAAPLATLAVSWLRVPSLGLCRRKVKPTTAAVRPPPGRGSMTYALRISKIGLAQPLSAWRIACADLKQGRSYIVAIFEDIACGELGEQWTEETSVVEEIRRRLGSWVDIIEIGDTSDDVPF